MSTEAKTLTAKRLAERALRPAVKTLSRTHSRFVGTVKIALFLSAGALILLLVVWPRLNGSGDGFRLSFADLRRDTEGNLGVTRARFAGTDGNDRPFVVTAANAVQQHGSFDVFALNGLQADITIGNGMWISVSAETGMYDRNERLLTLTGPIEIFSDQGYELHANSAVVDLAKGTIVSTQAVDGHGPMGAVRADGFRFTSAGGLLNLTGGVRVTAYPGA